MVLQLVDLLVYLMVLLLVHYWGFQKVHWKVYNSEPSLELKLDLDPRIE